MENKKALYLGYFKFFITAIIFFILIFLLNYYKGISGRNFDGAFYYYLFSYIAFGFLISFLLYFGSKLAGYKSFVVILILLMIFQYLLTTRITLIFYDYSQIILTLYGCLIYLLVLSIINIYRKSKNIITD